MFRRVAVLFGGIDGLLHGSPDCLGSVMGFLGKSFALLRGGKKEGEGFEWFGVKGVRQRNGVW